MMEKRGKFGSDYLIKKKKKENIHHSEKAKSLR